MYFVIVFSLHFFIIIHFILYFGQIFRQHYYYNFQFNLKNWKELLSLLMEFMFVCCVNGRESESVSIVPIDSSHNNNSSCSANWNRIFFLIDDVVELYLNREKNWILFFSHSCYSINILDIKKMKMVNVIFLLLFLSNDDSKEFQNWK